MASTVLITGGAGALARVLAPVLAERGDTVRLLDVRRPDDPVPAGAEIVVGDIRQQRDVVAAMDGVDVLVHAAAWHGIHLEDHPAEDFWSLNVDGTFVIYEAAAHRGVGRAIFSSTMGVYGESSSRADGAPAVRVHEDLPRLPSDIYGLSKVVGEETAAYFHRSRGLRGVALRYGMFVPEPFLRFGVRLLYGGVDERDVASAVVAAIDVLDAESDRPFRAYNVHSPLPFDEADAADLADDPMTVLARHWPDAPTLLERAGAELWGPVNAWYDVSQARRELGWQPRYDFGAFVEALRNGAKRVEEMAGRTRPG
jgi:UDP-glucose 4-epimerase